MIPSLIERLEQAVEGSRELDEVIRKLSENQKGSQRLSILVGRVLGRPVQHFTTQLSAAKKLIPENAFYHVGNIYQGIVGGYALVATSRNQYLSINDVIGECIPTPHDRKTEELALCIAALKVHAALRAREAA